MFGEDERPTGTTEDATGTTAEESAADGSDALAADGSATDAPDEQDERDQELERLRNVNKQLTSEKESSTQLAERLRREISEELRSTGAGQPRSTNPDPEQTPEFQRDVQMVRELQMGMQPTAEHLHAKARIDGYLIVKQQRQFEQKVADLERKFEESTLPSDKRDDVKKVAAEMGIPYKAALEIVTLRSQVNARKDKQDDDEEATATKAARRDAAPEQTPRAITANGVKVAVKESDYQRAISRFEDEDDMEGKRQYLARFKSGQRRRVPG